MTREEFNAIRPSRPVTRSLFVALLLHDKLHAKGEETSHLDPHMTTDKLADMSSTTSCQSIVWVEIYAASDTI